MTSKEKVMCNGIIHSASAAAATVGRTTSQVFIGWIPGLGNIINAATAASITETIGWIMAKEFEKYREFV